MAISIMPNFLKNLQESRVRRQLLPEEYLMSSPLYAPDHRLLIDLYKNQQGLIRGKYFVENEFLLFLSFIHS